MFVVVQYSNIFILFRYNTDTGYYGAVQKLLYDNSN